MEIFEKLFDFILGWLPLDPFIDYINSLSTPSYLGYVNWFFPVSDVLVVMSTWLTYLALYYLISVVLRKAGVIS